MQFSDLLYHSFRFHGVDGNRFRLGLLDDENKYLTLEAVEDPDDGYRSMMEEVRFVKTKDSIFFKDSLGMVRLFKSSDIDGYDLVDVGDNHVWLTIGTDVSDDYYPCFIFRYNPKEQI